MEKSILNLEEVCVQEGSRLSRVLKDIKTSKTLRTKDSGIGYSDSYSDTYGDSGYSDVGYSDSYGPC